MVQVGGETWSCLVAQARLKNLDSSRLKTSQMLGRSLCTTTSSSTFCLYKTHFTHICVLYVCVCVMFKLGVFSFIIIITTFFLISKTELGAFTLSYTPQTPF